MFASSITVKRPPSCYLHCLFIHHNICATITPDFPNKMDLSQSCQTDFIEHVPCAAQSKRLNGVYSNTCYCYVRMFSWYLRTSSALSFVLKKLIVRLDLLQIAAVKQRRWWRVSAACLALRAWITY